MFIWLSHSLLFILLIIYSSTLTSSLQFAARHRSPIHTHPQQQHTVRTAISSPLFNDLSASDTSNNSNSINSKSMIPYIAPWASGLLLFGVGYGVGSICAPGWQRQTVVMNKIGFTRIALALFISRDVWRSTPHWVKPRIARYARKVMNVLMLPLRKGKNVIEDASEDEDDDDDDLTNLSNFRDKVQNVMNVAKSKLDIKEDEQFNIEAAVLALLQMLWQVKAKSTRAISRDDIYRKSGTKHIPDDMLNGIDEFFELADLAYDEHKDGPLEKILNNMGYNLIKHDKTAVPGYLGHYIALSSKEKVAVIGVKGTSTVEDFCTDVCASAVQYDLPNEGGSLTCHEGIYISSERLYKQILPTVRDLLIPSGYKIVIVGHSLGKSALVLFHHVNVCVSYEVLVI